MKFNIVSANMLMMIAVSFDSRRRLHVFYVRIDLMHRKSFRKETRRSSSSKTETILIRIDKISSDKFFKHEQASRHCAASSMEITKPFSIRPTGRFDERNATSQLGFVAKSSTNSSMQACKIFEG